MATSEDPDEARFWNEKVVIQMEVFPYETVKCTNKMPS